MAYAGAFCLLQTYKMMKHDSDYKLMTYQNEILSATQDSSAVELAHADKLADLQSAKVAINAVKPDDTKELQRVMTEINGKGYDFSSASIDKALAEIELEITEETKDYKYALGDVAADEEVWQSKYDSEQTTNQMLQTNIENFQAMVQNNIAESHTYGYND